MVVNSMEDDDTNDDNMYTLYTKPFLSVMKANVRCLTASIPSSSGQIPIESRLRPQWNDCRNSIWMLKIRFQSFIGIQLVIRFKN